jgi:hypothetical protein
MQYSRILGVLLLAGFIAPAWGDVVINYTATTPINSFIAAAGLVNQSLVYNPSTQGAITSLDFSIQTEQVVNFASLQTTIGARAVILQGGKYYTAQASAVYPGNGVYVNESAIGWTANDFGLFNLTNSTIVDSASNTLGPGGIDLAVHPDFSNSGGVINFGTGGLFGFACGSGAAANVLCPFQFQDTVLRKNMSFTINDPIVLSDSTFSDIANYNIVDFVFQSDPSGSVTTNITATPEPRSELLLAGCFIVLMWLRSRSSRCTD